MGAKFGDIDINQILDNEFRIGVLEKVLDTITLKNQNLIGVTQVEIEEIRLTVANGLKQKYPNSGIEYKKLQ